MCQYSCAPSGPQTGVLTPLYLATIGHFAYKGAALAMMEATGVQPNGRISVNCPGLWNDAQAEGLKTIVDFVHSQGGLIGVQLSHAGRKGSTLAPWIAARLGKSSARADSAHGGWPEDVVGPMSGAANSWDGKGKDDPTGGYCEPRKMTEKDIKEMVVDWGKAAQRAVAAGVDTIEIHAAHGYLIHQFLSPLSNRRDDKYGGNFDNNIRVLVEVIQAVRAAIPTTMPLFVRISATDWMEESDLGKELGSWDVESTIRLAKMLPDLGVDVLDVSSAANHPAGRLTVFSAGEEQLKIAARIRKAVKDAGKHLLIGAVGMVTGAKQARDLVDDKNQEGNATADMIFIARQFLREPELVLNAAEELGVDVAWPIQIARAQIPRTKN